MPPLYVQEYASLEDHGEDRCQREAIFASVAVPKEGIVIRPIFT